MSKIQHFEALKIKEKLLDFDIRYNQYKALFETREKIEEAVELLEKQLHRLTAPTEHSHKIEQLKQLKKKKQIIDHQLDDLEEFNETDYERAFIATWNQFLDTHPDSNSIKPILHLRQLYQSRVRHLTQIKEEVKGIEETLKEMSSTRQSIRGWGLLQYVWGANPNIKIGHLLQECENKAKKAVHTIQEYQKGDPISFLASLETLLQSLMQRAKGKWGFHHIDTEFRQFMEQAASYIPQLEEFIAKNQKKEKETGEDMKAWLQTLS